MLLYLHNKKFYLSTNTNTCTILPTWLVIACMKWALLYTPSAATHLSCGPRARGDLKRKLHLEIKSGILILILILYIKY